MAHAPRAGHSPYQELVHGALPAQSAGQGSRVVPEAAEVLRLERAAHAPGEGDDEEEPIPPAEGDEVLPDDAVGLGGGGFASVQAGVQHVELTHSSQGNRVRDVVKMQITDEARRT